MTGFRDRRVLVAAGVLIAVLSGRVLPLSAQTVSGARAHVAALSQDIGSRIAGSENEARAADYIAGVFSEIGYEVQRQPFSFVMRGRSGGRVVESANIIATKGGDSDLGIIVGAHYDSQASGRGADDNASGVAVMLEVAEALMDVATPYTIRFVAFGAEEPGLRGSRHYVAEMDPSRIRTTIAMINLDSLIAGDVAYVYGSPGKSGVIRDWVLDRAAVMGVPLVTQPGANPDYPKGTTGDFSDHAPFEDAGIQYVYFESTNWALGDRDGYTQVDPGYGEDGYIWHTRYDTLEYIGRTFPGRIEERLGLFNRMLYEVLTRFGSP